MFDLLLKNARVVDPLNGIDAVMDVAVENGRIAAVERNCSGAAKETIDLTGLVLQPGIIDSHVHLGEMWGSPFGPRMLAMNGVTTCLDMAGPLENILDNVPKYGAGINMAILQYASPPFTFKNTTPSKAEMETLIDTSLEEGALGSNSWAATIRSRPRSLPFSSRRPWSAAPMWPGTRAPRRMARTLKA